MASATQVRPMSLRDIMLALEAESDHQHSLVVCDAKLCKLVSDAVSAIGKLEGAVLRRESWATNVLTVNRCPVCETGMYPTDVHCETCAAAKAKPEDEMDELRERILSEDWPCANNPL